MLSVSLCCLYEKLRGGYTTQRWTDRLIWAVCTVTNVVSIRLIWLMTVFLRRMLLRAVSLGAHTLIEKLIHGGRSILGIQWQSTEWISPTEEMDPVSLALSLTTLANYKSCDIIPGQSRPQLLNVLGRDNYRWEHGTKDGVAASGCYRRRV